MSCSLLRVNFLITCCFPTLRAILTNLSGESDSSSSMMSASVFVDLMLSLSCESVLRRRDVILKECRLMMCGGSLDASYASEA